MASANTRLPLALLLGALPLLSCGATEELRVPEPVAPLAGAPEGAPEGAQPWRQLVVERRAASLPGEAMQRVDALVGEWDVQVESLEDPQAPLVVASGRARIAPELGGRFLAWHARLVVGGEEVESHGLLGFDVEFEAYELHWVSELSSAQRVARGRGDPERGGLQLVTSVPDPASGALRHTRSVLTLETADRFSLEQSSLDPETSEWLVQRRTTYRRSPSAATDGAPGEGGGEVGQEHEAHPEQHQ